MSNLPLSNITVIALEQAVAAPFCSRQLADLGARVIKAAVRRGRKRALPAGECSWATLRRLRRTGVSGSVVE